MCLNLNNYPFKASIYSYGSTHMNLMVTTNEKHRIDSQEPKRKQFERKSSNHKRENKKKKKWIKKNYKNHQKTINGNKNIPINSYFKYQWTKCSNQKTQRGWLDLKKKQKPAILCLQETYFRMKDTQRLKVRGWKNVFHANGKQKKSG